MGVCSNQHGTHRNKNKCAIGLSQSDMCVGHSRIEENAILNEKHQQDKGNGNWVRWWDAAWEPVRGVPNMQRESSIFERVIKFYTPSLAGASPRICLFAQNDGFGDFLDRSVRTRKIYA